MATTWTNGLRHYVGTPPSTHSRTTRRPRRPYRHFRTNRYTLRAPLPEIKCYTGVLSSTIGSPSVGGIIISGVQEGGGPNQRIGRQITPLGMKLIGQAAADTSYNTCTYRLGIVRIRGTYSSVPSDYLASHTSIHNKELSTVIYDRTHTLTAGSINLNVPPTSYGGLANAINLKLRFKRKTIRFTGAAGDDDQSNTIIMLHTTYIGQTTLTGAWAFYYIDA